MNQATKLSTAEAIILQQVHDDIENDPSTLSRQLSMSRQRTITIIEHLKRKGLLAIDHDLDGLFVHLTRKGQKLIQYMWPESQN